MRKEIMPGDRPSRILTDLKLEDFSSEKKLLCIEELNNSDGSFIISSIIKDEIDKGHQVILIMCHNSIGHFHAISQKLGYNLNSLIDSRLYPIDIMKKIASQEFLVESNPMKNVYFEILSLIKTCDKLEKDVCFILENIGNLLLVGFENIFNFLQYLRAIISGRTQSKLVISYHNFSNDKKIQKFSTELKHIADTVVTLKDLTTGRASDMTGHMSVMTRNEKFFKLKSDYQYLLSDKHINVFSPGMNFLIH